MKTTILAGCLALALSAPAALAQTTSTAPTAPAAQTSTDWRSSKLLGTTVYNKANENIGEVADVVIGSDGAVTAVVLSVGGFLGMGEKHVAVPFKSVIASRTESNAVKLSVDTSKASLTAMPAYNYLKS